MECLKLAQEICKSMLSIESGDSIMIANHADGIKFTNHPNSL